MSSAIGACGFSSPETGVAEESTRLAEPQQKRRQPPSALNRNQRVPRNIDLYPVAPAQHGAPLFFRYIELQHCGGGAVRLVARFGPKPLKVV